MVRAPVVYLFPRMIVIMPLKGAIGDTLLCLHNQEVPVGLADLPQESRLGGTPIAKKSPCMAQLCRLLRRRLVGMGRMPFPIKTIHRHVGTADAFEEIGLGIDAHKNRQTFRRALAPKPAEKRRRVPQQEKRRNDVGAAGELLP